jgi:hypothetical protein
MERVPGWRLLGSEADGALEKLLLTDLAARRHGFCRLTALDLYRGYLRRFVQLDVSNVTLNALEDGLLELFYRLDQPLRPPRFFLWSEHTHLNNLENYLDIRLVIGRPPGFSANTTYPWWVKMYDNRVWDRVDWLQDDGTTLARPPSTTRPCFFAVDRVAVTDAESGRRKHCWALYAADDTVDTADFLAASDWPLRAGPPDPANPCYADSLARLLNRPAPPPHAHDLRCTTLGGVCLHRQWMRQLVGADVVLASHVSTQKSVRRSAGKPQFTRLGELVLQLPPPPEAPDPAVVLLDYRGQPFLPHPEVSAAVLHPAPRRQQPVREPFPLGAGQEARRPPGVASAVPRKRAVKRDFRGHHCHPCDNAEVFAHNVPSGQTQRLFRSRTGTFDWLEVLGLRQHAEAVRRCCQLSSMGYDVESCTSMTLCEAGQEEWRDLYRTLVGSHALPRRVTGTQRPVLIGLTDALSVDQGDPVEVLECEPGQSWELARRFAQRVLEMRDEAVAAKYELLSPLLEQLAVLKAGFLQFWEDQRRSPSAVPRPLSPPLIPWVPEVEEEEEEEDPAQRTRRKRRQRRVARASTTTPAAADIALKADRQRRQQVEAAWRQGVWGWLESNLLTLAHRFVVWGFNSKNYDLPLLLPALVIFFKEAGLGRVRIQREGTQIMSLTVDGITFQEVLRLLPPGMSLDRFREMCHLQDVRKMIFPFGQLDASQEFLAATELPARAEDWRNTLTGECPPQSSVDEARQFFATAGFPHVRAYLTHYLRADVSMLVQGVEKMRQTYLDLFGLDLVDSGKFTISGLSALAAQTHLARNRRLGMMVINDRRLYSILKQGIRGGLTAVYRTVAGRDADYTPYLRLDREQWKSQHAPGAVDPRSDTEVLERLRGINAHLLPPPYHDAEHLAYLDVAGLYSNAGEWIVWGESVGEGV